MLKVIQETTEGDIQGVIVRLPKLTSEGFHDTPPENLLPLDSLLFRHEVDIARLWLRTQKPLKSPIFTSAEAEQALNRWIQQYYPGMDPSVRHAAIIVACNLGCFAVRRIRGSRYGHLGISHTTIYLLRPPGWKEDVDAKLRRALRRAF